MVAIATANVTLVKPHSSDPPGEIAKSPAQQSGTLLTTAGVAVSTTRAVLTDVVVA